MVPPPFTRLPAELMSVSLESSRRLNPGVQVAGAAAVRRGARHDLASAAED